MSAASARAALIELASSWRTKGLQLEKTASTADARVFVIYAECARDLNEATITHLSSDDAPEIRVTVETFVAAMTDELVPAHIRQRIVNILLYGHPSGFESARITGRTTEGQASE